VSLPFVYTPRPHEWVSVKRDEACFVGTYENEHGLNGPPVQPGRYRATRSTGKPWAWEAIPS